MTKQTPSSDVATAFHWGAGWAHVEAGRLTEITPYDKDPEPSPLLAGVVDSVASTMRVRRPAVRRGFLDGTDQGEGRGRDEFVEVDWDTALDLAASHLGRIRREHGNEAIFGGSYGWASAGRFHHAQSQIHRFLNSIGGYTRSVDNYSFAAAMVITPHVVGEFRKMISGQTPWTVIAEHSDLVVAFGGIASRAMAVTSGGVGRHALPGLVHKARANGVDFVGLGPVRADLDDGLEAEWLHLRPGSDIAVMLGIAHTLITEGLHDEAFLDQYTVGFDKIRTYVLGLEDGLAKSPEWAAELSGLQASSIVALARRMAAARTMVCTALGVQRAQYGEQPIWMTIVLAAMLGQIGLPGGGFAIGYAQNASVGRPSHNLPWPKLPTGRNEVDAFIPVARIADMLLNPGADFTYDGRDLTYPDIKAVYWAGGNPFHHHQDLNRLRTAFRRPEVVIVNEPFWTATARHADIVFPTTTPLERNDWAMNNFEEVIVAMSQAIDPIGQARNDYDVFSELAERLGSADGFTEGRDETEWLKWMWERTQRRAKPQGIELPDYDDARRAGIIELPEPQTADDVMLSDFRADPDANRLTTPSGRLELWSKTVASFGYDDCPGHPVWLEPIEWLGAASARPTQLHLVSNQPRHRLHSQHDAGAESGRGKVAGREALTMHPNDAAARDLVDGDLVRVSNDRGACVAGLVVSTDVMTGVVQLPTGATYDPYDHPDLGEIDLHGNPNVLTRDIGTSSLAQGPSSSSTLVEVAKLATDVPAVRSFDPPLFATRSNTSG